MGGFFFREFNTLDCDLTHRARAIYMYLVSRANAENLCWASIATMASDMNMSVSTVKRALADLEKAKLIKREARYRENGGRTSSKITVFYPEKKVL